MVEDLKKVGQLYPNAKKQSSAHLQIEYNLASYHTISEPAFLLGCLRHKRTSAFVRYSGQS